jgi:putative integral membrane protein (TIGR02587 family)
VSDSLQEYGRGIAGGLLFSLPLLYTMEVWNAGFFIPPHRQLAYLVGTFVLLLGYNRYAGMHPHARWAEVVIDSVEEMGIGLALGALLLLALGRVGPELRIDEVMGRVVVGALTVAIGVSVGTAQLGGDPAQRGLDQRQVGVGGQLTLAVCGAVLVAGNMAPTEEIVLLGLELPPLQLVALGMISLLLGLLVLFFSDFVGARRWAGSASGVARLRGAIVTYAVALVSAAMILWLFGRFDHVPLSAVIGQTIALGVAATLGASAGRLLLQQ